MITIKIPAIAVDENGNEQHITLEVDHQWLSKNSDRTVRGGGYDGFVFEFVEEGEFDAFSQKKEEEAAVPLLDFEKGRTIGPF